MDNSAKSCYWACFKRRHEDRDFHGTRQPLGIEQRAFEQLLDSVIPLDPNHMPVLNGPNIPGAFLADNPHNVGLPPFEHLKASVDNAQSGDSAPTDNKLTLMQLGSSPNSDQTSVALVAEDGGEWQSPYCPRQVLQSSQTLPANRKAAKGYTNSRHRPRIRKRDELFLVHVTNRSSLLGVSASVTYSATQFHSRNRVLSLCSQAMNVVSQLPCAFTAARIISVKATRADVAHKFTVFGVPRLCW